MRRAQDNIKDDLGETQAVFEIRNDLNGLSAFVTTMMN
jgi:hypothetical protein